MYIYERTYRNEFFLEWERDKCCREQQKNTLFSIRFSENRAVYEIMWKSVEQDATDDNILQRMRT
jgi:hypothetical protein